MKVFKLENQMTNEEIERNIKAYKELDEELEKVMANFWGKYPEIEATYSGSVLYGTWGVERSKEFDGLKFKFNDEQMSKLVSEGECVVFHTDIINQRELKVRENENDKI